MYKVGDRIVYPMHGVGTIESVEKKSVLGHREEFYVMHLVNNGMKVMIPVKNGDSIGIRPVAGKTQVKKVLDVLKSAGTGAIEEDWKLRYEVNAGKVKSGDLTEVAEVARDLFRRGRARELSTMERKLYESAYNLIIYELAMSRDVNIEEAGNIVSEALSAE